MSFLSMVTAMVWHSLSVHSREPSVYSLISTNRKPAVTSAELDEDQLVNWRVENEVC